MIERSIDSEYCYSKLSPMQFFNSTSHESHQTKITLIMSIYIKKNVGICYPIGSVLHFGPNLQSPPIITIGLRMLLYIPMLIRRDKGDQRS